MYGYIARIAKIVFIILAVFRPSVALGSGRIYFLINQKKFPVAGVSAYEPILWPLSYIGWAGISSKGSLNIEQGFQIIEPLNFTAQFGSDFYKSKNVNNYLTLKVGVGLWD